MNKPENSRLLSLDVLRGLIMILLAAESCLFYHALPLAGARVPPFLLAHACRVCSY